MKEVATERAEARTATMCSSIGVEGDGDWVALRSEFMSVGKHGPHRPHHRYWWRVKEQRYYGS